MHKHFAKGFTVVELAAIIFIIGILASVSVAGYNGWQHRTAKNTLKSDLIAAASAMRSAGSFNNSYPSDIATLSESFKASPTVSLSLTLTGGGPPVYNNLTVVQNGVLFHSICGDLITEGYAKGVNQGGQMEQYISACNVYNNNQIQVNSAWNSRNFNTAVTSSTLPNVVNGINYNDPWRPQRDSLEKDFYQTWHQRFIDSGGSYPITTFWDASANQWWGTPIETLPTPSPNSNVATGQLYCIQGISVNSPSEAMHINGKSLQPLDGPC